MHYECKSGFLLKRGARARCDLGRLRCAVGEALTCCAVAAGQGTT